MQNDLEPGRNSDVPIGWLADAPLFIDSEQVSAFYDAVVMPEGETEKITISTKNMRLTKTNVGGKGGVKLGASAFLKTIFPFLDADVTGELSGGREKSNQDEQSDSIELRPIKNPHRQLIQLALHYSSNLPENVTYVENGDFAVVLDKAYQTQIPRALVFLDLEPQQSIVPVAAELASGRVVTLFEELAAETSKVARTLPPPYPAKDDPNATRAYWQWYSTNYQPITSMNVLEKGIGEGGRPRWVDYRIKIAADESLHLSIRGRGNYDTGVYAFSTIFRGHEHGLRIVGTLKSGPGLNVLAIFER